MKITDCPGTTPECDPAAIFERVLIPVDFSPTSRQALVIGCELRRQFGGKLFTFLLSDYGENDDFVRGLGAPWRAADVVEEARRQLQMFGESICLGSPCLEHESFVGEDPVRGIAEAAASCGATVILLPVHSDKSVFRKKADKISRAVDIPVMILPERPAGEANPGA